MMSDVLRETDPCNRERLLRDLVPDLRQGVADLERLLKPRNPYQFH